METNVDLDLSRFPKELKLLLKSICMESNAQLRLEDIHGINWNTFIELALHHRIYPLLYSKVKNKEMAVIPNNVRQIILKLCKRNTLQMLHLCGEMEQINRLGMTKQIPLLFLKGPVLAKDLYGDISQRTSSDLDLLVPLQRLEEMEELLLKDGYEKDEYIESILNDWKWRHHHFTYIHPKKEIKVEVHWRLNPGPGKEPRFNELWERRRVSDLTKSPLYFLGKEDLFLFLVSHGARHGWSRLRWLIDIHQFIESNPDWVKIHSLMKNNHYLHLGGQAILLTTQLLHTEMREEFRFLITGSRPKKLAKQAIFYLERQVNLHTDPVPEDVSKYHKQHLFTLMSKQQKVYFLLSLLYPFPTDAEVLPLPKKLHFLYFPLRPVLWAWRKRKIRKQVLQ